MKTGYYKVKYFNEWHIAFLKSSAESESGCDEWYMSAYHIRSESWMSEDEFDEIISGPILIINN